MYLILFFVLMFYYLLFYAYPISYSLVFYLLLHILLTGQGKQVVRLEIRLVLCYEVSWDSFMDLHISR